MSGEAALRLAAFLGAFALLAGLEAAWPRRTRRLRRGWRWPGNLGVVMLDAALLRLLVPAGAVGAALAAEAGGVGLLPWLDRMGLDRLGVGLPAWLAVPLAVVLLDLAIYLQHVLFHAVPALWRLHRMHHADLELDVTSGLRFHPLEMVLSLLLKMAVITALGAPPAAVLVFEVLLNASSMFNHANLRLPDPLDQALRRLLVTPDMHRVHHSLDPREANSNYGFNLALWDRLFGTYRAQPSGGHDGMAMGVAPFRDPAEQRLDRMLTQPWRG